MSRKSNLSRPSAGSSPESNLAGGFRFLFFSVGLAVAAGLSVRLYFSPARISNLVGEALARQEDRLELKFGAARLELANGSWPSFAIALSDVELGMQKACDSKPAIQISKLRVPMRVGALFEGRLAAGTVAAERVVVDLDRLRRFCPDGGSESSPGPGTHEVVSNKLGAEPKTAQGETSSATAVGSSKPWWNEKQLADVRDAIAGVALSQVEVQYEGGTKRVFFESLYLDTDYDKEHVQAVANIRLPPETTFGERVPPLKISARVRADRADLSARAYLSEGSLEMTAALEPTTHGDVAASIRATVNDVPLSTMMPLLVKTGITNESIRPKYLWLDCEASIEGRLKGLFKDNPLRIDGCELSGNWARLRLESAIRQADGSWDPFVIKLTGVDINRLFETIGREGPDGVASEYGRLSGEIEIRNPSEASLTGSLVGTTLRFSNRNVRALQRLNEIHMRGELTGEKIVGQIDKILVEEGEFDGRLSVVIDRKSGDGKLQAQIAKLQLAPKIQQLLVRGSWGGLSGLADLDFVDGKAAALRGEMRATDVVGSEYRFPKASVQIGLVQTGAVSVSLRAPVFEVSQLSPIFLASRPIFTGHQFQDEWVKIDDLMVKLQLDGNGALQWEKVQGSLADGKFKFQSNGAVSSRQSISGSLTLEHPVLKKRLWSLGGTAESPALREQ